MQEGISLLGGWVPLTVEIVAVAVLVAAIGWRTKRWRLAWVPVSVLFGVLLALAARAYMNDQGMASDPAPFTLWVWTAAFGTATAIAVLGWRGARWWRRALAILGIPLTLLSTALALNQWVGYYPSVQSAWGALTAGPLPNEVSVSALPSLRNTNPSTGKFVKVDTPSEASGFTHRSEYVYLPPAWFAGATPPKLPVVMMIGGEFNTPADWMRSGDIAPAIDDYANKHGGQTPIFVFVDVGGSFNNDTECVNGPRGNSADHLTKDVRPFVVSEFGALAKPENWGVLGWSMGGTCAIGLTVMHPDLFTTFVDIGGDHGPTSGTKEQTIARLYGGDATQYDLFDPLTVMKKHGPYQGVSGWFADTVDPSNADELMNKAKSGMGKQKSSGPVGFGGNQDMFEPDPDAKKAADDLCTAAEAVDISCSVHKTVGFHSWQFAAATFSEVLPWLAHRVQTPGSAESE